MCSFATMNHMELEFHLSLLCPYAGPFGVLEGLEEKPS